MRQFKIKYQLKQMTKTKEKMLQPITTILKKMGLKFQNLSFNILCKIAFCDKQKWQNKELIIWSKLHR